MQQILDTNLLKDIYPATFDFGWGWYIIIFIILLSFIFLLTWYTHARKKNFYRRIALAELVSYKPLLAVNNISIVKINKILKFTAIHAYNSALATRKKQKHKNSTNPSALVGKHWIAYLDKHCFGQDKPFTNSLMHLLTETIYKPTSTANIEEIQHLYNLSFEWIKKHKC